VPVIDNLSFDASVRAVIEAAMDELAAQEERARAEEPPALF
jgi:hypothetical protein